MSNTACAHGPIFSDSLPGQVAELLAADGVQRPEHHDLLVLAPLHDGLEAGADRQRRLAGAGAAAERDDADLGVEQEVERDPLLGRAAVDAEGVAVAAHQLDVLVGRHPTEPAALVGDEHQAGVARQVARLGEVELAGLVERVEVGAVDVDLAHPGPAGLERELGPVLLGDEADRRRLDPHRQVLGDERDVVPLVGEVARHRQDAGVVVAEPEAGGERLGVGVVELDPDGAALLADRQGDVEGAVLHAQVVEETQRRPREVAELGVVPLPLQLGDHDDGDDDLVLVEPGDRRGVRQKDAGVQDEGVAFRGGAWDGARALLHSHGCLLGEPARPCAGP